MIQASSAAAALPQALLTRRKPRRYDHRVAGAKRTREAKKDAARPVGAVLRFTREHLWVRWDGVCAQIGLSEHGQEQLGEIIAFELPEVGDPVEAGSTFGELESVRTVQELKAPASGTVTAVNADLDDHPVLVNEDPFHDGWLIEVKLDDDSELEHLLAEDEYEESIADEEE